MFSGAGPMFTMPMAGVASPGHCHITPGVRALSLTGQGSTMRRTGRQYIGVKILKQFLEPFGLFEGKVVDVSEDKDEGEDDKLTFHLIYEDGTKEQWDENSLLQGEQLWLCINQHWELESGNDEVVALSCEASITMGQFLHNQH